MSSSAAATPAAVVFDCDGLLVDSETAWTRAEATLYAKHGVTFELEHKKDLLGSSGALAIATMERHLGLPAGAGEPLLVELNDLALAEVRAGAPVMPGVVELIAALRAAGVPIGVASNSPMPLIEASLTGVGLMDVFDHVVSAHECEHGKPAPDVYLEACRRLGAAPEDSVAFEDSPTGVAAARAAGLHVVGVPSLEGVDLPAAHEVVASLHAPAVYAAVGLRRAA
jgi:HAD superfamily hydrolase (TIGR01509 family)